MRIVNTALFLVSLLGAAPLPSAPTEGPDTARAPAFGRYGGEIRIALRAAEGGSSTQVESLFLRLLPEGFGLVDFPDRRIFGFPVAPLDMEGDGLSFTMGGGAGALHFEGRATGPVGSGRLSGRVSQGAVNGAFVLGPAPLPADYGETFETAVAGGLLRGSLLLPRTLGPWPLVILVSGPGATDRDGNNYQVPGRNDALALLASSLAERGVATLRYDKRGAGESLALAPDESRLRFDDYVTDLRVLVAAFRADARFGRIVVAGDSEGALVAAAALDPGETGRAVFEGVDLVLLAAAAESARDTFSKAIEAAPPEYLEEGRAILERVEAGGIWPTPSPYYADFFRPSFQAYLSSWLHYSLKDILPRLRARLLLVQGDRDMQVSLADFLSIAALRPSDPALVIEGMNHVLKTVPPEVEANFASFSDPAFPVAPGLVTGLAAFARGEPLPDTLARVDGGKLPRTARDVDGMPTGRRGLY
jgi:hypothetical protein